MAVLRRRIDERAVKPQQRDTRLNLYCTGLRASPAANLHFLCYRFLPFPFCGSRLVHDLLMYGRAFLPRRRGKAESGPCRAFAALRCRAGMTGRSRLDWQGCRPDHGTPPAGPAEGDGPNRGISARIFRAAVPPGRSQLLHFRHDGCSVDRSGQISRADCFIDVEASDEDINMLNWLYNAANVSVRV